MSSQTISVHQVRVFRKRAIENAYKLVRVRTSSKAPLAAGWQHGEARESLLNVGEDSLNTGVLLGDLRCVDLDIDDPDVLLEVMREARRHLPLGALIRCRPGSSRLSLFYQAEAGQPPKRAINGAKGKIEILGHGQQAVVHGQHPSGASIGWRYGRGPDTVPIDEVPKVSEAQISVFLDGCAPLLEPVSVVEASTDHHPRKGEWKLPSAFASMPLDNDLAAGIEPAPNWFTQLPPGEKYSLVKECLKTQDNRTTDPRDEWVRILFAVADAERVGCPNGRQLALDWSRGGASWTTEADFEMVWASYKPKPGGITVGSLLAMAANAGLDLSPWRDAALLPGHPKTGGNAQNTASACPAAAQVRPPLATPVANLPLLRKRQWLCGTYLVRGAVTVVYAPGGRAKTTWLITVGLSCASGRDLLDAHVFGGPQTVLYWSVEDSLAEVTLRVRAGMKHHGLTDADLPGLYVIGADQWGLSLLQPSGKATLLDTRGWAALIAELDRTTPDVLVIDPLINIMGGVSANDNAAAALLMGKLVELAAQRRISIALAHHSSKGRDPASAESAMGAVTFINLARIAVAIEPLAEKDAGAIGLPPWEAKSIFRAVGTKQNLSPPTSNDKYFRIRSIDMQNAEPPIYTEGDNVAVVEVFRPGASGPAFPQQLVRDALLAIDAASPPLSPSKRSTDRYAAPAIAQAIASHRGGQASELEGKAVLDHLLGGGLVAAQDVKFPRAGGRSDTRKGLVLTPAGNAAMQIGQFAPTSTKQPPRPPQCPANTSRDDAGGEPPGSPATPGGCGGNAGGILAGAPRTERPSNSLEEDGSSLPQVAQPIPTPAAGRARAPTEPARVDIPTRLPETAAEPPPTSTEPTVGSDSRSSLPTRRTSPPSDAPPALAENEDGLDIPPFLRRTQPATITLKVSSPPAVPACCTHNRLRDRPKHLSGTPLNPFTPCRPHFRTSRRAVGRRPNRTLHHRFRSSIV
jgi:hypothetical protein